MDLRSRLEQDMKEALRAGDRVRLATIRMLRAAVQNADIAAGRRLDEQGIIEVLARELKLRREALDEYRRAGRAEQVAQLEQEIQVVQGYLPEPLSEAEIAELARQAAAEAGAKGPQDMGRVMGLLMPRVKGRADGSVVSRIVREELARLQSPS
ncbi:MAG: GatB/YqeY domain-containing protein [Thermaerobacter sp.]|nr:aspartyl-tRNA amidotransferase [Bacillota bacterium]